VGYFRTWWGNFTVSENAAVTPADFTQYCVTAPSDPRLPGGGGNQICGNYDVSPARFGQSQTLVTLNNNQSQVYNGVDATVNARVKGLYVNGGLSTGFTSTNMCPIVQNNPQVSFASPRVDA